MASIKKRPNGKWRARYRDTDHREHARHFDRRVDAQAWLDAKTAELVRGEHVAPQSGRRLFEPFAREWLAAQAFSESSREQTEMRLRVHLVPTFGSMELRQIRPSTVQAWLRGKSQTHAPAHVRVMLVNLSQILSAAVDDRLIAANPCDARSVKAPRVDRPQIVPWPVEQVLAVVEQHPSRWRGIPVLAAGCGLRQGEVLGVHVDAVDFLRRTVRVERQVKYVGGQLLVDAPKGGRVREVPLPDWVAVELAEQLRRHPARDDRLIFTSTRGGLVNRSTYNQHVWRPALERAGVATGRGNGLHVLRHTYASVLLDQGVSIKAVSEWLGHASAAFTLDVYGHLMPTPTTGDVRPWTLSMAPTR